MLWHKLSETLTLPRCSAEHIRLGSHVQRSKKKNRKRVSKPLTCPVDMSVFYSSLSFELTGAQKRVINECIEDMRRPLSMTRLVQGDVGSGKTVVAAALMYYAKMCGAQSAMMAPTEVLAVQHHSNLSSLFKKLGITRQRHFKRLGEAV